MPVSSVRSISASQACALKHPLQLGRMAAHHAQLRVFRQLPSAFLPGHRDVTVYLPPDYALDTQRRYPVLYLHDGQNLFDPATSFIPGRYWQVAETADRVIEAGEVEPLIVVGVNNTGARRLAEYTHSTDPRNGGGGEADCYGLLLTEELMPFIDATFRTRAGAEHTGIGGSSLGGLVSLYLGLKYPERFGRIAALSPSIWWDRRSILKVVERAGTPEPLPRIWLDAGDNEGPRTHLDVELLAHQLERQGWRDGRDFKWEIVPGGTHDEQAWAGRMGDVLRWLFGTSALG